MQIIQLLIDARHCLWYLMNFTNFSTWWKPYSFKKISFVLLIFFYTRDRNISLNWPQIQVLLTNKSLIRIQIMEIQIYPQIYTVQCIAMEESYES